MCGLIDKERIAHLQCFKMTISFSEYNNNENVLIFLHNAGGNRNFIKSQSEYCAKLGYHVFNLDLPGHGLSLPLSNDYKVEFIADLIRNFCRDKGIQKATFIGLNYGGNIAIEIASTSELVIKLILIDPPILMEEWAIKLVSDHINELTDIPKENFAEDLVSAVLLKGTIEEREMAIESFNSIPKAILASIYRNLIEWDKNSSDKLAKCKMPILYIQSNKPFCAEESIRKLCPQSISSTVDNTGHWMTIDAPDLINSLIYGFINKTNN